MCSISIQLLKVPFKGVTVLNVKVVFHIKLSYVLKEMNNNVSAP